MKNKILFVLVAIFTGFFSANFLINNYKKDTVQASENNVYLFQYGVYSSLDSMKENLSHLEKYFYYEKNNKYYVLIGISYNKNNLDKIKNAFNVNDEIYVKKIKIDNSYLIENLKQYDKLIIKTSDNEVIINSEMKLLKMFEESVLNDENIN